MRPEIGDPMGVPLICSYSGCSKVKNVRSDMSSRFIMSDVVSWFGIAFCDCSSFCFMHPYARLRGMEVNSEVTSNYTIRSTLSSFAMYSLSKNSLDYSVVVNQYTLHHSQPYLTAPNTIDLLI